MNRAASLTRAQAVVLTAALSILITLALAAPVISDPVTQLFGYALVGRHHDPFTVMEQYATGTVAEPYLQPATDWIGIALSRLIGPLSTYNAITLMTFPLSALAAFAHARHVIGDARGAMVAALLFMMSPFHLAHAAYHVHIAQVQWLPLFFLALWRLVERPALWRALALAAASLLVGASSFYFGFVAAVVAPVAALAYAWLTPPTSPASARSRAVWPLATLAVVGVVLLGAVWRWFPPLIENPQAFAFPEEALDQHAARWWSYLLPPAGHVLFGDASSAIWRAGGIGQGLLEQQLSLGIAAIALAATSLLIGRASLAATFTSGHAQALVATAVFAAVCSLPPQLTVGPLTVPMPSALLYHLAPMFRAYARFGVIASLMVTTLAGAGFVLLLERRSKRATTVAIGLLVVACLEYFPPLPASRDALPTSAHRSLANDNGVRLFDCTVATTGATAGVSLLMRAQVHFPASPLGDCADPELGAKLAAFGFTTLLVRRDTDAGEWLTDGGQIAGVRALRTYEDGLVFEVRPGKPPLYTTEISGFYPREYRGRDTWRWLGQAGAMSVISLEPGPMVFRLEIDVEAYADTRRLRVTIDDQDVDIIVVTTVRQSATTAPFTLTPGVHTIRFESDGTRIPTQQGGGAIDTRPLSVRVFGWQWRRSPAP